MMLRRVLQATAWVGAAEMAAALVLGALGLAPVGAALVAYACGLVAWAEASARAGAP